MQHCFWLHQNLSVPVTCKIRLLPKLSDTVKLCLALERAVFLANSSWPNEGEQATTDR